MMQQFLEQANTTNFNTTQSKVLQNYRQSSELTSAHMRAGTQIEIAKNMLGNDINYRKFQDTKANKFIPKDPKASLERLNY